VEAQSCDSQGKCREEKEGYECLEGFEKGDKTCQKSWIEVTFCEKEEGSPEEGFFPPSFRIPKTVIVTAATCTSSCQEGG